jgi:arylformamidase
MSMGSHSGTHIDAPSHYLEDADSTDKLSLEVLIGEALVVDLTYLGESTSKSNNSDNDSGRSKTCVKSANMEITVCDLEPIDLVGITRLLLKTPNSKLYEQGSFTDRYACLLYTSPSPRDRTRSRMPSSA